MVIRDLHGKTILLCLIILSPTKSLSLLLRPHIRGHTDWGVPTITELLMLISYNKYKSAIIGGFNYVEDNFYWSSTSFKDDSTKNWGVDFRDGFITQWRKLRPSCTMRTHYQPSKTIILYPILLELLDRIIKIY